ncbi:hypothetical protein [Nocardia sp. NPDC059239]|uniref:TRADD-N-associated membrane domain-containing protein n=1 Tax=unclassified Nocardia TaxID=2637762 RepID=UPI00368AB706
MDDLPNDRADQPLPAQEPRHAVIVGSSGYQVNYFRGPGFLSSLAALLRRPKPPVDAAAQKLQFSFRFLNHSLWQSTITFALSMIITTAGAVILLLGASMALRHVGEQRVNYTGVVTGLSGVIITTCGGAFSVQANKARQHAKEQVKQVHEDLKEDLAYDRQQREQAREQEKKDQANDRAAVKIDKIKDDDLRDRLLAISALNELGLTPNPVDLTKHLPMKQVESERLPDDGQITS